MSAFHICSRKAASGKEFSGARKQVQERQAVRISHSVEVQLASLLLLGTRAQEDGCRVSLYDLTQPVNRCLEKMVARSEPIRAEHEAAGTRRERHGEIDMHEFEREPQGSAGPKCLYGAKS